MYIRSDESDYVQIGNLFLPRDASQYGYKSADEISKIARRNYQAELDAKAAEEKRLADAARGQINYEKAFGNIREGEGVPVDDQLNDMFDVLVPPEGCCDNLGGELVRAMMRVMYRNWNDGDLFYEGYGLETCCSDAAFIMDNTDDSISSKLYSIAESGLDDEHGNEYTDKLNEVAGDLIAYLREHPEVFGQDTVDSRNYNSSTINEIKDAAPTYEYDVEVPYRVQEHIDAGHIEWDDVWEEIRGYAEYDLGGDVNNWCLDGCTIEGLDREQLAAWEHDCPRWLNQWAEDLDKEYPFDDEEAGEEEEYDEDDSDEDI